MTNLRAETNNCKNIGHREQIDWINNHRILYDWIIAVNLTCFMGDPLTPKSIMKDSKLIDCAKRFHLEPQNKEQMLHKIVHQITHNWFWEYVDRYRYIGRHHGKEFQKKIKRLGIFCDETGFHWGINRNFFELMKEVDEISSRIFVREIQK